MVYVLVFILGLAIGGAVVYFLNRRVRKDTEQAFRALSLEALTRNSGEFLKLANETLSKHAQTGTAELEGKRQLIDKTFEDMKVNLKNVEQLITGFEKDRTKKYEEISNQLKNTAEATGKLQDTTGHLQSALASRTARGQWGERMAEDILQLAGFIEGVNYQKQKSLDATSSRPDFTFLLPQDLKVNMDVKFPLDNYMKYQSGDNDPVRETYKAQFLRDVRQRIKEVTTRDYISPEDKTVNYVLVFIPNEQVYCFMNECDNTLVDEALKNRVILCSPFSLYAILAVIHQATDNFNVAKTTSEILSLLAAFGKQWLQFKNQMDTMGKRIDSARDEYQRLMTTRANQLESVLVKIDVLRKQKGLPVADADGPASMLTESRDGIEEERR